MPQIAVVTPSHLPDLERCALLAESVARFASPEYRHVVVVPRREALGFRRRLEPHGATVMLQEDFLPSWLIQLPVTRKWQLSPVGWPVRGWIRQQVIKMAFGALSTADAILFVDSDITFVRPFDRTLVLREDGRVRLLSEPGVGDEEPHHQWYRRACRMVGIPVKEYYGHGFVGPLATWVPEHARGLVARIEAVTGREWKRLLLHQRTMSEYILYGLYVEEFLGVGASRHFADGRPNPVLQHYVGALPDERLLGFLGTLQDHHRAVLVQSRTAHSFEVYEAAVRRLWEGRAAR